MAKENGPKEVKDPKEVEDQKEVKDPKEVEETKEETKTPKEKKPRKWWKTLLIVIGAIVGFIVVLIVALQIILSPAVLTKAVNDIAEDYVDGEVIFGRAGVSMIRHFPNLSVRIDSVTITYPTERFAEYELNTPLMKKGRGEVRDTLAAFDRFTLSINLIPLIGGNISLRMIDLDKPRIYAKSYAEGVANWNIFKTGEAQEFVEEIIGEIEAEAETMEEAEKGSISENTDEEAESPAITQAEEEGNAEETAETEEAAETEEGGEAENAQEAEGGSMPSITIGRIKLSNKPVIVFCSVPDDLYATVGFRNMQFRGKLTTANFYSNKLGFKLDSLYIFGRFQDDSLAFGLQKLQLKQVNGVINLDLNASARIATGSTGRMSLPISVKSEFTLPKDTVPTISINSLVANFAGVPFKAKAEVKYFKDRLLVDADMAIDKCKVKDVIDNFGKNFWPEITNFHTDAVITLKASAHGPYYFDNSAIPEVTLSLDIPDTPIVNRKMKLDSHIGLAVWAKGGRSSTLDVGIDDLHFMGNTIQLDFKGGVTDLLGKDPDFNMDTKLSIALDSLAKGIESQLGYKVDGSFVAAAKGGIKMSQMNLYNFASADMWAFARVNNFYVADKGGNLDFHLDSLSILAGTQENERDSTIELGTRLMSIAMKLDSLAFRYKDSLTLNAGDLRISAWNDAALLNNNEEEEDTFHPLSGTVKIGSLYMTDNGALTLNLLGSENKFTVKPSPKDKEIPVLNLSTSNESFRGKLNHNRVAFGDLDLSITAQRTGAKRTKAAKAFVDSLARKYSDVPRGELLAYAREKAVNIPDWLAEDDFKDSNLDFKLDETIAKYYKEWDFEGSLNLDRAILITPALPLRNTLTKVGMTVNNDSFTLKNMTIKSGKSDFSAKGLISGLRQGLLNNGTISVNVSTHSDELNINEMLTAYTLGQKITAKLDSLSGAADALSDDDYMDMVAIDTISGTQAPKTPLLVIPANLNAKVTLDASKVAYSIMDMTSLHSDITMKERCLQIINTGANSNVGDLSLEAFYSTRSKEDISAGFNINFKDITAEKIVEMIPAVDSIMPMLTSFRGNLNCLLAATADIDTLMNIQLPSLEGVLRIQGKDLALVDSEDLYKIAKILLKDPYNIQIDDMSVEALLKDNTLEIFPFLLSVGGRYKLALSGVQNLDQSFKYHVSVIKSPLVIRFGVNITGDDFSKMKIKIGKAAYKDENVQVFSTVIDETQLSLSDAIRNVFNKGVDAALRQAKDFSAIEGLRQSTNYVNPAESDIEDLDEDEAKMVETMEEEAESEEAASL